MRSQAATCLFETPRRAEATVLLTRLNLKESSVDLSFYEILYASLMLADKHIYTRSNIVLVIFMIVISSCIAITPTPISLLEPEPRPEFIECVGPEESSLVTQELYNGSYYEVAGCRRVEDGYASSICVSFSLDTLVQRGDDLVTDDRIFERIELLVDDSTTLDQPHTIWSGGVLSFQGEIGDPHTRWSAIDAGCWKVPLSVGVHKVSFLFRQTSGDIQSYTWYFAIIDN